jgi:hypothetical protein
MIYIILIIAIFSYILFILFKRHKKNKWMNTILDKCYKNKEKNESCIVLSKYYECPTHQICHAAHIIKCQNFGKARYIDCYEYNNNLYIALAHKKMTDTTIYNEFKYKGEYRSLRSRPGCDESIFRF